MEIRGRSVQNPTRPEWVIERFTARYHGRGEFYSGIQTGEQVEVQVESRHYVWDGDLKRAVFVSIQSIENRGAWLSVQLEDLEFLS